MAQTDNWSGAVNSNWGLPSNWSNGLPTPASTVNINASTVNVTLPASDPNAAVATFVYANKANINVQNGGALTVGSLLSVSSNSNLTVQAQGTLQGVVFIDYNSTANFLGSTGSDQGYHQIFSQGGTISFGVDAKGVASGTSQSSGDINTFGSIVIGKAGAPATTLTMNVSNLTYDNHVGNSEYDFTGSTVVGAITGNGNLVVTAGDNSSRGQLNLDGVSSYTGTTTITGNATLNLIGGASIASSQSVSITDGGVLALYGSTTTIHNLSGDSTAQVNLEGILNVVQSVNTSFQGIIAGDGSLGVSGVLTLTNANSYSGSTTIGSGSTLVLSSGGTIAQSSQVNLNGTLNIASSTAGETINNLNGSGSVILGAKNLTINGISTSTSTFGGSISGTGNLTLTGAGHWIVTGDNTYSGTTTLSNNAFVQIGNGGTTGTLGAGAITLGGGTTLAIDYAANSTYTLANALSGAGTINQLNGTTFLTGDTTGFTGTTNVNGGILEVDGPAKLNSTVNVNSGALVGTGTFGGLVNVNSAFLAVGTSPGVTGTMTLQNGLTLSSGSTVVLRTGGGASDAINVTGGATTLAGTLVFETSGSTTLSANNALRGITTVGTPGGAFDTTIIAGNGTLRLGGVTEGLQNLVVEQGATLEIADPAGNAVASVASSTTINGQLNVIGGNGRVVNLWGSGTIAAGSNILYVTEKTGVTTLFSGTITGSATFEASNLQVENGGRLILTGNNTYTGQTDVNGSGTVLQVGNGGTTGTVGSGQIAIDSGATVAFYHADGVNTLIDNHLWGTGTLEVDGGNVILGNNGDAGSFTGTVTVNGGSLEVDNSLIDGKITPTAVNVNGGTLRGNGLIVSNVTVRGGNLAAGTASTPGTLTIQGNLAMQSDSTAGFRVAGPASDLVHVTGDAHIAGNAAFYVSGMTVRDGTALNVMKIDGTETGNFSSVTSGLNNALYYRSAYDSRNKYLQFIATQGSFVPFSAGGNQAAVAANFDSQVHDPRSTAIIDYLNTLPGGQLSRAFSQVAPTSAVALPTVLLASADNVSQSLSQRMGTVRDGSTGLALQNLNLGDKQFDPASLLADNSETAPIGYTPLPADFLAPLSTNKWGTFISGLGTAGSVNDSDIPGYDYYAGGFEAGVDYRFLPSLIVGIAGGYQHGRADFNDSSSRITTDSGNARLYATWKDDSGNWVSGSGGGAYDWFKSKRDSLGGTADAKPKGTEINGMIEGGHDFHTATNWTVTPTLGLLYNRVAIDRFTESGSLTPLSVDSHSADSLRSRLGVTLASAVHAGSLLLNPYVQAGWQHEYLDESDSVTARFASGAGGVFTTSGRSVGSDSAFFGLGVGSLLTPDVSLNVGYFGQANSNYLENNLQGTVRYQF